MIDYAKVREQLPDLIRKSYELLDGLLAKQQALDASGGLEPGLFFLPSVMKEFQGARADDGSLVLSISISPVSAVSVANAIAGKILERGGHVETNSHHPKCETCDYRGDDLMLGKCLRCLAGAQP